MSEDEQVCWIHTRKKRNGTRIPNVDTVLETLHAERTDERPVVWALANGYGDAILINPHKSVDCMRCHAIRGLDSTLYAWFEGIDGDRDFLVNCAHVHINSLLTWKFWGSTVRSDDRLINTSFCISSALQLS